MKASKIAKNNIEEFNNKKEYKLFLLEDIGFIIDFLFPYYVKEGKNQLVIAVGCTGGKHRSVTVANRLYERLKEHSEIGLKLEHRDIEMDNRTKG